MRHQTSVAVLGHLGAPLLSSSLADQLIHIGTCSSSSVQYSNCWHWPLLCWTDIAVSSRSDSPPPPPPWRRKICSSARPNWPAGRAWNSSCGIQSPTSCSAVPPRVGVSGAICRPASRCDLLLPPPPFFPALLSASFSCPFIAFHRTSFTELVGFYQDLARTSLWGWYGLYCLLLGFTASDSSMPPPPPELGWFTHWARSSWRKKQRAVISVPCRRCPHRHEGHVFSVRESSSLPEQGSQRSSEREEQKIASITFVIWVYRVGN